jgi:hypothetical protein
MRHDASASIAQVLAAPWHQRRNAGDGLRGAALVGVLCFAAPIGLLAWSLVCAPAQAAHMRQGAAASAWVGCGALLIAAWAMLVGNVLVQNKPALARLVPGHVVRLRGALLVAWTVMVLAAAAGPGFAFDAPLAWACGTAGALALFTAALRWPVLWLVAIVAPFAAPVLLSFVATDHLKAELAASWARDDWLFTAVVVTAGALVLVGVVRSGGRGHRAAYEAGRLVARSLGLGERVSAPAAVVPAITGLRAVASRPYEWWLARSLARGDSPAKARLLMGLGPSLHWSLRLGEILWIVVFGGIALFVFVANTAPDVRGLILAWASFSVLLTLGMTSSQAAGRLRKTQREQALLMLLPGAPADAAASRWLSLQMTLQALLTMAVGMLLSWALAVAAEATSRGSMLHALGGIGPLYAVTLVPMLLLLWRRWPRLPAASSFDHIPTLLVQVALAVVALLLHLGTGASYPAIGAGFAIVTFALCAWRWRRMADEPAALPVGRLA